MKGQPIPITGDGKMTRDFTYVQDIVEALMSAGISERTILKRAPFVSILLEPK